jgi:hypothetical protein
MTVTVIGFSVFTALGVIALLLSWLGQRQQDRDANSAAA